VPDLDDVPEAAWARTQLFYVCSPGNPTGAVLDLDVWRTPVRALPTATASSSPPTSATRRSTSTSEPRRWARCRRRRRSGAATIDGLLVFG
jgi:hypothetical protein